MMLQNASDLEKRAVEEILAEIKRAATRAEVGGSLSWAKPKRKGVNKRFLNNTVLSSVIQNSRSRKVPTSFSIPPKFQPNNADEPRTQNLTNKSANLNPMKKRVTVSHKSRFKAYLSASKKGKEKAELEDSVEVDVPTSTEKSIQKDK